jgi:N-acetylmuramoyl-L-alanine amidase
MFALLVLLLAAGATFATAVPVAAVQTGDQTAVERQFNDAVAKETAVQKALAEPDAQASVLKAVRTVVADFERIVRQFPSSGYADDALWRGSKVSMDAFKRFREVHDRDAAMRLLRQLASQYPTSRQAKLVPSQMRAIELIKPVSPSGAQQAAAEPTAPAQPEPPATRPLPEPPPARPQQPSAPAEATGTAATTPPVPLATIKGIRRSVLQDTVRIIIDIDKEVAFHDERLANPARVFVDLPATRSNPALIDQTIRFESDADIVRQVRVGRHPNATTRIVLDVEGVSSYSVYPLYNPYRLVIDCLKATAAASAGTTAVKPAVKPVATTSAPAAVAPRVPPVLAAKRVASSALVVSPSDDLPPPVRPPLLTSRVVGGMWMRPLPWVTPSNAKLIASAAVAPLPVITTAPPSATTVAGAPSQNLGGGLSMARQLGLGVSRIVIDPGHGGHDPGAKTGDMTEAELVLDIALRVEKLLAAVPGVEVVLTRRTDDFVPLQERTAIANREAADLFLSIHGNANPSTMVRGVETYFLNFANTETAAAVAARENASSGQTMAVLPDVVKTIALNNKLDESRDFATYVQRSMIEKLRTTDKTTRDLGVKQAPFVVLVGAAMPSVLAEVSFLTNPQEARLLKGPAYRQRIAEALFDAVRKYQAALKSAPAVAQQ